MKYNLLSQRFGLLVVLDRHDTQKRGQYWRCLCDCGNVVNVVSSALVSANTQSCGCKRKVSLGRVNAERKASAMSREERLERRKVWNKRYKERYTEKCKRIQAESNRKRKDAMLKWREENSDQYKVAKRKHYENNKEKYYQNARDFAKANPEWKASHCAKRRALKKKAIPQWADFSQIQTLYEKASTYGFHVDHIVPLTSSRVCGLHCWGNLQLLDGSLNSQKSNNVWPDM